MPGYIVHLSIANELKQTISKIDKDDKFFKNFRLGNILPDFLKEKDKKDSHYWDDITHGKIARKPNIDLFMERNKYSGVKDFIHDPLILGYYFHLLSDYYFIDEYWGSKFTFYNKEMQVTDSYIETRYVKNNDTFQVFDRNDFFSDKIYYGDYDILNSFFKEKYHIVKCPSININDNSNFIVDKVKVQKYNLLTMIDGYNEESKKCRVLDIEEIDLYIKKTVERLQRIIEKY